MIKELTPEQVAIIQSVASNPVTIVSAGPGCAKTTTIEFAILAVSGLVNSVWKGRNAPDPPILCLAFNKDISVEIAKWLTSNINKGSILKAESPTLNSYGQRLWTTHLGDSAYLRLNARKTREIIKDIQDTGRWSVAPEELDDLLSLVTMAKANGFLPPKSGAMPFKSPSFEAICELADVVPEPHYKPLLEEVLRKSIALAHRGEIDFDDQIYMPALFAVDFPKPTYLFVDEAQDLTPLQMHLLHRIKALYLCLVGDPLQAIYAFRGAMSNSFEQLAAKWPNAVHLPLQTSFRVPKEVLPLLQRHNHLLRTASPYQGHLATLQAAYTMEDLFTKQGTQAILCRNNAPLFRVALACIATQVPFHMANSHFGVGIIRDIKRATGSPATYPAETLSTLMFNHWTKSEMSPSQFEVVKDKVAAVDTVSQGLDTAQDVITAINRLLYKPNPSDSSPHIHLSTAHKAKGLEFDWVMHLDPSLIPARFATSPEELAQEANIAYVINSRTKHTLVFCNSDQILIPGTTTRKKPATHRRQHL